MALVEVTTPTRLYVELPVLLQRQQLADSLARYLTTLGLQASRPVRADTARVPAEPER
jgi:hypothetical protein